MKPPVHSRYNEKEALTNIVRRYERGRKIIGNQVAALQQDSAFLALCDDYYRLDYKDWLILMGIMNSMLNWKLELPVGVFDRSVAQTAFEIAVKKIEGDVYPTWRFDRETMDRSIQVFNLTVLQTWGFEPRRRDFSIDVVDRFLRHRMRHYDLDVPHQPMFGLPPGPWPEVKGE